MPQPTRPNAALGTTQDVPSKPRQNLDETTAYGATDQTAVPPPFGAPATTGEVGVLGPYRLVREMGRGSMGAVYEAVDTRLERPVALKVMLPQFAGDADGKARFLREARAAARVSHDNIVTVYEADERDGVAYIAMQYLTGCTLDRYLKKQGEPNLAQTLRIGRETAAGLAAAHRLGLVHRDIKPGNLWLEAPNGRVKILDFGLARPVEVQAQLTQSGMILGTPAYMSPEQARGAHVDARSDLFSLGAVLYRLMTGRTAFQGTNTMALLVSLAVDEPPAITTLNPSVPEPIAQFVHHLLAKKPEDRPGSAEEAAKRLRQLAELAVKKN